MTKYGESIVRAELFLLGFLPLFYGILIFPSYDSAIIFSYGKIFLLCLFIFKISVLRNISKPKIVWSNVPKLILHQPSYVKAALLFTLSLIISAIFSSNTPQSWLGAAGSPVGVLFGILCFLVFCFYCTAAAPRRTGVVILIVVISLITILEYLGFRPLSPITDYHSRITAAYPIATVGQRGQLAGLLLILTLLPLHWYFGRRKDWYFWSLLILSSIALGCTTNSAALISIAIIIPVYVILEWHYGMRGALLFAIPLTVALCMSVSQPLTSFNKYLISEGLVEKVSDSKDIRSTSTFETRKLLWKSALNMSMRKPILGWGSQTFNGQWFHHLSEDDADHLLTLEAVLKKGQRFKRVDNAILFFDEKGKSFAQIYNYESSHNTILDILYGQGILGVAALVFFVSACLVSAYRFVGIRGIVAMLPFAGYAIYLQAWFPVVTVTGIAVMLLGITLSELKEASRMATSNG